MQIRDRFLDYLKGVSIYLVAIGHCFNQEDYEHPYLAMFSMPLFMAISGYFFYPSVEKVNVKDYIIKKFFRLYLPSLVWGTIGAFIMILFKMYTSKSIDGFYILHLVFVGLWFLTTLFILQVIGALIHKCFYKLPYVLLCWLLVWLIVCFTPNVFVLKYVEAMLPFFVLGFVWKRMKNDIPVFVGLISIIVFYVVSRFFFWSDTMYSMDVDCFSFSYLKSTILRLVAGLSGIISVLWLVRLLYRFCVRYIKTLEGVVVYIGTVTLPIYALHQKFLIPLRFLPFELPLSIRLTLLPLIIVALSIVFYLLLSKVRLLRMILFGEK